MKTYTEDQLAAQFPGIVPAFAYVLSSYEFMAKRLEAVEGRMRALLTVVSGFTLGGPAFLIATTGPVTFASAWFWLAMTAALIAALTGTIGSVVGTIQTPRPQTIYDEALRFKEHEFKRRALWWAAKAFDENNALVKRKGAAADGMAALLVAEVICLLMWSFTAR